MSKNRIKQKGEINLAGINLSCFVLEDGTRVLSSQDMKNALKMVDKNGKQKSLKPLIYKGKVSIHFDPIICYDGERKINGYEATILLDICDAFLEARKQGKLSTDREKIIAEQCEMLVRAFAKVGIIALIDEATGYQHEREKTELQTILKTFVSDEILKWQKTFQTDFYKEIFRLWNIPFTAENIKKRPRFIGWSTNELIYKNMPENSFISDELKVKASKKEENVYNRLNQSLTPTGKENLKKTIYSVETLASISKSWNKFTRLMKEKYHPERDLPFIDLEAMDSKEQETDFDQMLKVLLSTPPIRRKREIK
ncbi:P63C domain-containing protein [endosymbiont GvMRE of Glomus versiforme]|uniref:P63C domain-containing protein n=1 Tax=endosymbiont GvMRE of Glomus versiforme TaxID=2039283 RepID=UPI000EF10995|nr:P63C domain-containing protein [endosymbiont GvMRE of Glomus versiforme]RHZ36254.1 p63C domain protein [endosymbiont GvMRE of Glomus versiforme]